MPVTSARNFFFLILSLFLLVACATNTRSTKSKSGFVKEKDLTVSKLVSDALSSLKESKAQQAVNLLEEALELEPSSKIIKENLAQACLQASLLEKAKMYYSELQLIDPKNSVYTLALGDIEFTDAKFQNAKDLYLQAKQKEEMQPVIDQKRLQLIVERLADAESKLNAPIPTATPA